jgi:hypothetical protein
MKLRAIYLYVPNLQTCLVVINLSVNVFPRSLNLGSQKRYAWMSFYRYISPCDKESWDSCQGTVRNDKDFRRTMLLSPCLAKRGFSLSHRLIQLLRPLTSNLRAIYLILPIFILQLASTLSPSSRLLYLLS